MPSNTSNQSNTIKSNIINDMARVIQSKQYNQKQYNQQYGLSNTIKAIQSKGI